MVFARSLFFLYIVLAPFYIFPSGLPQPADLVLVLLFTSLFLKRDFFVKLSQVKKVKTLLLLFLLVVSLVNMTHSFYRYAIKGLATSIFNSIFYYVFNILVFFSTVYCLIINKVKLHSTLSLAILITSCVLFVFALLNISGPQSESRGTLFFNNPNQLGYYVLLISTLFVNLEKSKYVTLFSKSVVLFISFFLILYSNSRAALFGVIILLCILLYEFFNTSLYKMFFCGLVLVFLVPILVQSEFYSNQVNTLEGRNIRDENKGVPQYKIRGYDRILLHPHYLIYGAGEGDNARFNAYHSGEMHSGFGTILFSYGLVGFILFAIAMISIIKGSSFVVLLTLLPVLLYNLTHQGLRSSMLWILLAVICLNSKK